MKTASIQNDFFKTLMTVNRIKANELISKLYKENDNYKVIEVLILHTLEKIGQGFQNGDLSLSQVYMSGIICEELIDRYSPPVIQNKGQYKILAIGTLLDHHALGKRMVLSVLKSGGINILDLGQGLSVNELVEKSIENKIDILLISALMLPSALKVKEVKEKLKNLGSKIKIIVGGAPFRLDKTLWQQVNADADGKNATDVLKIIEKFVGDINE